MLQENRVTDKGGGTSPPSFANVLGRASNVNQVKLIQRNVLVFRVKKDESSQDRYFDGKMCEALCEKLGINPAADTEGFQSYIDRADVMVELWFKNHILAEKYASDVS